MVAAPATSRWTIAEWLKSVNDEPVVLLLDDMAGATMIELTTREHDRIDEYRARGAALLNTARRPPYAQPGSSDEA